MKLNKTNPINEWKKLMHEGKNKNGKMLMKKARWAGYNLIGEGFGINNDSIMAGNKINGMAVKNNWALRMDIGRLKD